MPSENAKAPAPAGRLELPPLDLLRSFEAAARHLRFPKAAEEQFLTQSAIRRLKKQLV